eukprot:m.80754 g.80754  ORF g.80754 m.80754 type:complete len:274 (+) comp12030_c0_seq1:188-1009(+)
MDNLILGSEFMFEEYPHPKVSPTATTSGNNITTMSNEMNHGVTDSDPIPLASMNIEEMRPVSDKLLESLQFTDGDRQTSSSSTNSTASMSGSYKKEPVLFADQQQDVDWLTLEKQLNMCSTNEHHQLLIHNQHPHSSFPPQSHPSTSPSTGRNSPVMSKEKGDGRSSANKGKAKRRRRKEPKRGDYSSDDDFNREWSRWRRERDSNNLSVQRSRNKSRKATEQLKQHRDSLQSRVNELEAELKAVKALAVRGFLQPEQLTSADIDLIHSFKQQ